MISWLDKSVGPKFPVSIFDFELHEILLYERSSLFSKFE